MLPSFSSAGPFVPVFPARNRMPFRVRHLQWLPLVAACTVAVPAVGQQRVITSADYAKAERAMAAPAAVTALADAGRVAPNWLANDQFWYRNGDGQFL